MNAVILVADDEEKLVRLVSSYLSVAGYDVISAGDGIEALKAAGRNRPDCAVLDINMPRMDGLALARELRMIDPGLPVIFLSARGDEADRISGLELGADDYVTKPFSPRELTARVKAVLRRGGRAVQGQIRLRGMILDPAKRIVTVDGTARDLTAVQFSILHALMMEPGRVFDRPTILERAVGPAFEGFERTLDAHIKNLRKAIGDSGDNPRFIGTVRGIGYKFIESADET